MQNYEVALEEVLGRVYEGIMARGNIVANTAEEWRDDFIDYWMDGHVPLDSVQFVTKHLRAMHGKVEPSAGMFIGEWLNDHHNELMARRSTAKLTWLELARAILALPEEELARPAEVWMYADTSTYEGGHFVYGINPYDESEPIGDGNHSSIDIG